MSIDQKTGAEKGCLTITFNLENIDPVLLYRQALNSFLADGATNDEAIAWLGTEEEPNIDACTKQVMHPSIVPGQAGRIDATVSFVRENQPILRTSTIVHASTGSITKAELERIESLFEPVTETGDMKLERKCFEHVRHGPLYLSPKDYGFYARIPEQDPQDPKQWRDLSPEMRDLVNAAIRQGASTIEFDSDEEIVKGLYDSEDV